VLVTHYMDEAERLCDRVAVLPAASSPPTTSP
jgi:ABC-type multidrug transport system ATPase subunit